MSWSHLQSATNGADGSASVAQAFTTSNLISGSKIIAAVSSYPSGSPATSVHDGASNALTEIGSASVGNCNLSLWAMDTPAGDVGIKPTITASASGASAISIVIQEISGLLTGNTTAMCDGTLASTTGTGSTPTTPTYASSVANEYLVSIYGDSEDTTTTWTGPGSPWTSDPGQNATFITSVGISYKDSTGGTESNGYTIDNSESWAVLMVAFKLPGTSASVTGVGASISVAGGIGVASNGTFDSTPGYASAFSDLANGAGSWVNGANAEGAPNSTYATWTAP